MANYMKVKSQDHASPEEGFTDIYHEHTHFNHPLESVPVVLPDLLN